MKPTVEGAFVFEHIAYHKRAWRVLGGRMRYEDDDCIIDAVVTHPWSTDHGSIPDLPLLSWFIAYIGGLWDEGFQMHDLLWLLRVLMRGQYDRKFTNRVMKRMHRHSLDRYVEGMPWYRRYWHRSKGWLTINAIQAGVGSKAAQHKWENPDTEVLTWTHPLITITWKKETA